MPWLSAIAARNPLNPAHAIGYADIEALSWPWHERDEALRARLALAEQLDDACVVLRDVLDAVASSGAASAAAAAAGGAAAAAAAGEAAAAGGAAAVAAAGGAGGAAAVAAAGGAAAVAAAGGAAAAGAAGGATAVAAAGGAAAVAAAGGASAAAADGDERRVPRAAVVAAVHARYGGEGAVVSLTQLRNVLTMLVGAHALPYALARGAVWDRATDDLVLRPSRATAARVAAACPLPRTGVIGLPLLRAEFAGAVVDAATLLRRRERVPSSLRFLFD